MVSGALRSPAHEIKYKVIIRQVARSGCGYVRYKVEGYAQVTLRYHASTNDFTSAHGSQLSQQVHLVRRLT